MSLGIVVAPPTDGRAAARSVCWSTWSKRWFDALERHPRVTAGSRENPPTVWVLYAEASFDLDWPRYDLSGRNYEVATRPDCEDHAWAQTERAIPAALHQLAAITPPARRSDPPALLVVLSGRPMPLVRGGGGGGGGNGSNATTASGGVALVRASLEFELRRQPSHRLRPRRDLPMPPAPTLRPSDLAVLRALPPPPHGAASDGTCGDGYATRYLASFRGRSNHPVRAQLAAAFRRASTSKQQQQQHRQQRQHYRYLVEVVHTSPADERRAQYLDVLNTSFALVPRGHSLWSYRMVEALAAGAVPVLVADRLPLPFDGLAGVRWSDFSLTHAEGKVHTLPARLAAMVATPSGRAQVCTMRRAARRAFDLHFGTIEAQVDTFVEALLGLRAQWPARTRGGGS